MCGGEEPCGSRVNRQQMYRFPPCALLTVATGFVNATHKGFSEIGLAVVGDRSACIISVNRHSIQMNINAHIPIPR